MPTEIQVRNRYMHYEYVVGAAVTFDDEPITPKTPRTKPPYGFLTIQTANLKDGEHVMHVIPNPTSDQPVGPAVAEGLGEHVTRMYRSLDVNIKVQKGSITSYSVPLKLTEN